ncbi:MAG TPA: hypothetical protein VNW15_07295 [Rhizomicrobium sp.]|nr:hypothetical protein [Rhizomicrobium sp.]
MAEETQAQVSGAEASGAGADPAAMALALGGASRERADAFLKKQEALIEDLRHHLREQFKRLKMGVISDRLSITLKILTGIVGVAFAAGLALMIWDAAHADGLVIESFSVPPDLAAKGLTGQVVATQMLDRLTAMQSGVISARSPKTFASNWGDDIKVEIPQTGISVSEASRFLRGWLGHETRISGEIIHTEAGIAVTARVGVDSGTTFTGAESDLDALVQKAAERLYRVTQPYRYGVYLESQGRHSEGIPVLQALARSGPASERAWAYFGLGNFSDDARQGLGFLQRSAELDPSNALAIGNAANSENILGRAEQALRDKKKGLALLSGSEHGQVREDYVPAVRLTIQSSLDSYLGANRDAALAYAEYLQSGDTPGYGLSGLLALFQAEAHDPDAARATLANALPEPPGGVDTATFSNGLARISIAFTMKDWSDVLRQDAALEPLFLKRSGYRPGYHVSTEPMVALAAAALGRFADAEARIGDTPADCYLCLRMRAEIAELKGDQARADQWFAEAAAAAPSIPFAYFDWGQVLLERGQPDAAIAKFAIANQKGPKFADPLEAWGEALMKQNRSDRALAKFEEAEKYAPNWGRLHLKWGEALSYAGRKDEARVQYQKASVLDLGAADRAELAKVVPG